MSQFIILEDRAININRIEFVKCTKHGDREVCDILMANGMKLFYSGSIEELFSQDCISLNIPVDMEIHGMPPSSAMSDMADRNRE